MQSLFNIVLAGISTVLSVGLEGTIEWNETDSFVSLPGLPPSSALPRLSEGVHLGDTLDGMSHPTSTHFDFSSCTLDQLQEEERESDRYVLHHKYRD